MAAPAPAAAPPTGAQSTSISRSACSAARIFLIFFLEAASVTLMPLTRTPFLMRKPLRLGLVAAGAAPSLAACLAAFFSDFFCFCSVCSFSTALQSASDLGRWLPRECKQQ